MSPKVRRTLFVGLALLLAISILSSLVLLVALERSFAKLQYTRIFPIGFHHDSRISIRDIPARGSIAFWGDSRAYSWDKAALSNGKVTLNFAHGAMTSSQVLLHIQGLPDFHTEISIVQTGINDLHPLGVLPSEKEQILRQLTANIRAIRDQLLLRSDVVVLTTIFPPAHVPLIRRFAWDPATLRYIDQVNDEIRTMADGHRVVIFDAHELLVDESSYLAEMYVDDDFFLHVNASAYATLNSKLQELLQVVPLAATTDVRE